MNDKEIRQLHAQIVRVHGSVRKAELTLARLLAAMEACGGFRLYAASMREYADSVLGLDRGKGGDLLRIGRRLPRLPLLEAAMEDGRVTWTKAREIVKVAEAETEAGWVELGAQWTSRLLAQAVRQAAPGDDAPRPEEKTRLATAVLRFEGLEIQAEVVRTAMAAVRASCGDGGERPDDMAVLVLMSERIMAEVVAAKPVEAPQFRVVVQQCPDCETTSQVGLADGAVADVEKNDVEMIGCDAELVSNLEGSKGRASNVISHRVRRQVQIRDNHRCAVPMCNNAHWLHLHHVVFRSRGGPSTVDNLVNVCSVHHRLVHDGGLHIERDQRGGFAFDWPRAMRR